MDDVRLMAAAIALSERGVGVTGVNPNVGCIIVTDGHVVGRGWTQPGGRPHAEAMALAAAGPLARGATAYVTLEPCAHVSPRGPCCAGGLIEAGIARLVIAAGDPDTRTNGQGIAMARAAGIAVEDGVLADSARAAMAGYFTRAALGRPHVTLKLATSLDGRIALPDGSGRWITGSGARTHAHVARARADAILVGRGTLDADRPRLDVRLAGLEHRSPRPIMLSRSGDGLPEGWLHIDRPGAIADAVPGHWLLIEGGAGAAAAFLAEDLVDRLLLYRAPILLGEGRPAIGDVGLTALSAAHGRWRRVESRRFGADSAEVYLRTRNA